MRRDTFIKSVAALAVGYGLPLSTLAGGMTVTTMITANPGGGSDGNFTAALGIPTLDGLGAVGEGAHAAHESILLDRVADRVALLEIGRAHV